MSLYVDTGVKRVLMLKEWKNWVTKIASAVRELIPGAEVYVVGSIVRGDFTGGSDVDVLVVSPATPDKPLEKARIKATVEERLGLPCYHPFEIHFVKPWEAQDYLKRARGAVVKVE